MSAAYSVRKLADRPSGSSLILALIFASATSFTGPFTAAARADVGPYHHWTGDAPDSSTQSSSDEKRPMIYDIAPAMARAAVANVQFNRADATLTLTMQQVRRDFENSSDYLSAVRELEDARQAYTDASQPVLDMLRRNPDYQTMIQRRTEMEIALATPPLTETEKLDLAHRKLEYSSAATRMESALLAEDTNVQQARLRLRAAEQSLADKIARFESGLSSTPSIAAARQNYEAALLNKVGSNAYLAGAWLTRSDTIDADQRRYPEQPQYVSPFPDWTPYPYLYGPYYAGYYGLTITRF